MAGGGSDAVGGGGEGDDDQQALMEGRGGSLEVLGISGLEGSVVSSRFADAVLWEREGETLTLAFRLSSQDRSPSSGRLALPSRAKLSSPVSHDLNSPFSSRWAVSDATDPSLPPHFPPFRSYTERIASYSILSIHSLSWLSRLHDALTHSIIPP